jgi:hypothetical protein
LQTAGLRGLQLRLGGFYQEGRCRRQLNTLTILRPT